VDRYIRDYHRVELLWKHDIADPDQISHMTRLSKRVIRQYIDLLPEKLRKRVSKNHKNKNEVDSNSLNTVIPESGETEAGSAGEQPARDSQTHGNE
jgi:hypothetical protein